MKQIVAAICNSVTIPRSCLRGHGKSINPFLHSFRATDIQYTDSKSITAARDAHAKKVIGHRQMSKYSVKRRKQKVVYGRSKAESLSASRIQNFQKMRVEQVRTYGTCPAKTWHVAMRASRTVVFALTISETQIFEMCGKIATQRPMRFLPSFIRAAHVATRNSQKNKRDPWRRGDVQ
jgi:hypothetical protein